MRLACKPDEVEPCIVDQAGNRWLGREGAILSSQPQTRETRVPGLPLAGGRVTVRKRLGRTIALDWLGRGSLTLRVGLDGLAHTSGWWESKG